MKTDAKRIEERAVSKRGPGTTCVLEPRRPAGRRETNQTDEVDAFVARLGFTGLGDRWVQITRDQAKTILNRILQKDLVHKMPVMNENDAAQVAEDFLSFSDEASQFFTDGNMILPDACPTAPSGASYSISTSTFDTGVVALGEGWIGILWIQEED